MALESDANLAETARKALEQVAAHAVTVVNGPLPEGCAVRGPYDVIVVNGLVQAISPHGAQGAAQGWRAAGDAGGRGAEHQKPCFIARFEAK